MKAADFATIVHAYGDDVADLGRKEEAKSLHLLASIFEGFGSASVAVVAKRIAANLNPSRASGPRLGDVARRIAALQRLFGASAAKTAAKDAALLANLLNANSGMALDDLLAASAAPARRTASGSRAPRAGATMTIREDVVAGLVAGLEAAVGNPEAFNKVQAQLVGGAGLTQAELFALTKRFSGVTPRSRPDALKKIAAVHQEVMVSRRKLAATGGRTAA